MSRLTIKLRKLVFRFTPKRLRSPFSRDDPWLAKYDIGEWTYGHPKVLDWGSGARLKVGRFCSIAGNVTIIVDGEHHTDWVSAYPLPRMLDEAKGAPGCVVAKGDLIIGNDVWIGDGATILSGVRVGNGAVIGARSMVVKDVPAYSIVGGNPAGLIRMRFSPDQIAALEGIAWWDWPLPKIKEAMPLLMSKSVDEFIKKYGKVT